MADLSRRGVFALALLAALFAASVALAADHDLDPSFSGDGTAVFEQRTGAGSSGIAVDAAGRIVQSGRIFAGGEADWLLMRATAAGRLDESFGDGGFTALDFASFDDQATDVLMQGSNILVTGFADTGIRNAIGLARLTDAGELDLGFGGDGKIIYDGTGAMPLDPYALALDPVTGQILVTGTNTEAGTGGGDGFPAFIARFSPDGVPDPTFGNVPGADGLSLETFGGASGPFGIAVQSDRRPVAVGGTIGVDFAVLRRTVTGAPDNSFSSDGETFIDFAGKIDLGTDIAIQPDGKLVVVGYAQNAAETQFDFAIARLNPDGSLDVDQATDGTPGSFGASGKVTVDFGTTGLARGVELTGDGKILVAGLVGTGTGLVRLNSDGSPDTSFSGDGKLTPAEQNGCASFEPTDLALVSGKAIIGGTSYGPTDAFFALARYGTATPLTGPPDCAPPETSITSGPAEGSATTDTTPTFGLSSTQAGSAFECSIDSGPFAPCSGPGDAHTTAALTPGPHTLAVRAVDQAQNVDPTPASRAFTVTAPPADTDSDGIADSADNCPADANPTQKDTDSDDIGDVCDEDPSLPASCKLRKARSRVFVYTKKDKVRLVVRYRTGGGARVTTTYTALLKGGRKLQIGRLAKSFSAVGTFRLAKNLPKAKMRKVRAAKGFLVVFKIPGTPGSCARFYTKRLTKKRSVSGQKVWFQADSVLTGF